MDKDTELLKVQVYADYAHSRYTVQASYILSAIVAYFFAIFGLRLQNYLALELYWILVAVPIPFFGYMLYSTHKTYVQRMARVDELIKKANTMQSLPSIEEMTSGKAWKKK